MRASHRIIFVFATILALGIPAGTARADMNLGYTSTFETAPAVASNSVTGEFAVAYLTEDSVDKRVIVRLFDGEGSQQGSDLFPFGSLDAIVRPEIIYNPDRNEFLVAGILSGTPNDDVQVRRVDADGNLLGTARSLFTGLTNRKYGAFMNMNVNPIRATYNAMLSEYVVITCLDTGTTSQRRTIYGQRMSDDLSTFRTEVNLSTHTLDFQAWSYSIAYGPASSTPYGGHYLFAYSWDTQGQSRLDLLDSTLAPIVSPIPFDWGTPAQQAGWADVAWGVVQNTATFFVVWSDGNNTLGPESWTGIWGSFIDPDRTSYNPTPDNAPFPFSFIPWHLGNFQLYKPRVAYNRSAQAFFVAWNEKPTNHPDNAPDLCTHIRGNWVDYPEFDVAEHPYPNVVISDVTCTCVPGTGDCDSEEDPRLPDVAPFGTGSAVVVWEQDFPPNPVDKDIIGDMFGHSPPPNDDWTSPEILTGLYVEAECTLLGATPDGGSSCFVGTDEPDVWFQYTAPAHGMLLVNTCGTVNMFGPGTGVDTVLSIHEPAHADQIALEACNDDVLDHGQGDLCGGQSWADSWLSWPMPAGETFLMRVTRFPGTGGGPCRFNLEFAEGGGGAGHVGRDGIFNGAPPMTIAKEPGGELTLMWDVSCNGADEDYAVYEGEFGFWNTHVPKLCSTGGMIEATIEPEPGPRYFIVVPHNWTFEGSYGVDSFSVERPQGPEVCRPQLVNACP
jgi:hypothetical protein